MKKPKISVLMPVFNGERYLKSAIKSILNQSFKDFEFIIVNDASTDKTFQIITSFNDRRIKIISNHKNLGVTGSLNAGLKHVRGKYVARMDADDISQKDRIKKQVNFLDNHQNYVLVGSIFSLIDEQSRKINEKFVRIGYTNLPITDEQIRQEIFIRNCISHPSVVIKTKSLKKTGGYNNLFNGAEDYDLWFKLLKIGKFHNLNEALIKRRWHKNAVAIQSHIKIEFLALLIRIHNIGFLWQKNKS